MLVILAAATGAVVGFVWQKRRDRRLPDGEREQGEADGGHLLLSNSRRAAVTSLMLLRTVTVHAFKRTAQHYAPVPLTFSTAVFSSLPSLFGTAFCVNFVILNAVPLVGNLLRARNRTGAAAFEDHPERGGDIVRALCASGGIVGFVCFQRAWERSPLRGSLSVFGKDPHLDRCASAERYLAEKLVLLTYGGYRRITTVTQLVRANLPSGGGSLEAAIPLRNYAQRAMRASNVMLSHVDGVFAEYGNRYITTHRELGDLANKLRYPDSVRQLETLTNASDALLTPLRSRQTAADVAAKLEELRKELGGQFHYGPVMVTINLLAGVFLGVEIAQLPMLRDV